jgi:erythromycin esterase-like protein
MWANWEVVAFAEWMKKYNKDLSVDKKIGFYGLDVYWIFRANRPLFSAVKRPLILNCIF